MAKNKKPPKCCKPDCFHCPYTECRYEGMDTSDYTETNERDYELYEDSTGMKYHKGTDKAYMYKRQTAYHRENSRERDHSEYMHKYYLAHREEISERNKRVYDTKKNTIRCRQYRRKNAAKMREYNR